MCFRAGSEKWQLSRMHKKLMSIARRRFKSILLFSVSLIIVQLSIIIVRKQINTILLTSL